MPLLRCLQLKRAIDKILARPGAERPEKARFFRSQMQNIITKALTDSNIKPVPSRRCFSVMCEYTEAAVQTAVLQTNGGAAAQAPGSTDPRAPRVLARAAWIQERLDSVYKKDPRYNDKAMSLFNLDLGPPEVSTGYAQHLHGLVVHERYCKPMQGRQSYACNLLRVCLQPLPDALRGEQWAFVQLPLRQLQSMLKRVENVSGRFCKHSIEHSTVVEPMCLYAHLPGSELILQLMQLSQAVLGLVWLCGREPVFVFLPLSLPVG